MNLLLTLYDEQGARILVNWNNVCYAENRGTDDDEAPHARIHFNVTAGTGAMDIEVEEDLDDIASLLEAEGEQVFELEDEDEDEAQSPTP